MQINYHSTLIKIQKFQKKKKKKKKGFFFFFWYRLVCLVSVGNARNRPVHSQYGRYLNRYETSTFRYRYMYWYNRYRYDIDHLTVNKL